MAKPRVFISSTYYDLKHVRASLEIFVESLGFEPILAEYGSIPYDPSQPLDESCYREAQSSDILVLIVGGRYGSIAKSPDSSEKKLEEDLESITRKEFSKAHDADIPVFVQIEHGVFSEYQTYLKNKENSTIAYAHVDSVRVFQFIEYIYSKQRNNPVSSFEKGVDIEIWLREQWAGIFQELLRQRKDNSRISDLSSQIRQLEAVNTTLKSYLETVLQSVSPEKSSELIERENLTLSRSQMIEKLRENPWFNYITSKVKLPSKEILDEYLKIDSVNDITAVHKNLVVDKNDRIDILDTLLMYEDARRDFNKLREITSQKPVRFSKKFLDDLGLLVLKEKENAGFATSLPPISI
jgi:Domain of unknown function (DUF4062)